VIGLQADIDCMHDHMAHGVQWRYLINVAGQSYPLRTPEEMVDILRIYNGANDIEGIYTRRILARYKTVCGYCCVTIPPTGKTSPVVDDRC